MNKQEHEAYFKVFCKLNDLFPPFTSLKCPQFEIWEHFATCYWEDYRNGNCNVDANAAPFYLERIREVGYVLLCRPVDPGEDDEGDVEELTYTPPYKVGKEIFNEQECRQIQEDLAIIELIYILTMCSGARFITDEEWAEITRVLTHNSPARNHYESLIPRVVDWFRANPVLLLGDSEAEMEVAEKYRQLFS